VWRRVWEADLAKTVLTDGTIVGAVQRAASAQNELSPSIWRSILTRTAELGAMRRFEWRWSRIYAISRS
jgi:hypothetical protein